MVFIVLHYIITVNVSINKELYCNHINHVISSYIPPKCCKEKEPEDKQLCIAVHTINNNTCDTDPLDNLINKAQLTKLYITIS